MNKPGWKTTEFWVTAVPGLLVTILEPIMNSGLALPGWAGPALMAVYALARGMAKLNQA